MTEKEFHQLCLTFGYRPNLYRASTLGKHSYTWELNPMRSYRRLEYDAVAAPAISGLPAKHATGKDLTILQYAVDIDEDIYPMASCYIINGSDIPF